MRNTYILGFILFSLVTSIGCKKEDQIQKTDVYVAGKVITSSGTKAVYWKNGKQYDLTDGTFYAYAHAIFVKGPDIYVVGGIRKGSNYQATLWKNGVQTNLTDGNYNSRASSLFIAGNDVYIGGEENTKAEYWKNGQQFEITDGNVRAYVDGIFVSGNDVYLAGSEGDTAKYWRNGKSYNLTGGSNSSGATSIFVSGQDVYVACQEVINNQNVLSYFKNGSKYPLGTFMEGTVSSINVINNDVYVGGDLREFPDESGTRITYWKNGIATKVSNPSEICWNFSMCIDQGDIYNAGQYRTLP